MRQRYNAHIVDINWFRLRYRNVNTKTFHTFDFQIKIKKCTQCHLLNRYQRRYLYLETEEFIDGNEIARSY